MRVLTTAERSELVACHLARATARGPEVLADHLAALSRAQLDGALMILAQVDTCGIQPAAPLPALTAAAAAGPRELLDAIRELNREEAELAATRALYLQHRLAATRLTARATAAMN